MTLNDLRNAIDRAHRRIILTVGRGRITAINDSVKNVQYAQVKLGENEIRDNTPRLAEFGFSSNPPIGSDAVVIFVGGDRSNGVIIATGDQSTRPSDMKPGESQMYDAFGKYIYLKADGTIEIQAAGGDVNILDAGTVKVVASTKVRLETPILEVTGDIIDNCESQTHTMAGMRTIYDIHTHSGIQPGGGNTAVPNEQM